MIQKSPGTALRIPDKKFATTINPNFRMSSRDDFGSESKLVGIDGVDGRETQSGTICETTDTEGRITFTKISTDRVEAERTAGVELGDESDAVGCSRVIRLRMGCRCLWRGGPLR